MLESGTNYSRKIYNSQPNFQRYFLGRSRYVYLPRPHSWTRPHTLKEGGSMPPEIIKGLKDVYFDTTKSSFIDGEVGKLLYRGYNIHDLAEKSTFEEGV